MKLIDYLSVGMKKETKNIVELSHTAAHIGSGNLRVLSTPWMIAFMEITARTLLDEFLPETHTSLGVKVNIDHLAPAAIESEVVSMAEITAIEKNLVVLNIQASHNGELVGKGIHHRYVVEIERYLKRVNAQINHG